MIKKGYKFTSAMFKRYLIAGLLIWVPIGITFLVIKFIVDLLDGLVLALPPQYRPQEWMGFYMPGVGVIITLLLVFFTGMITANVLGHKLVKLYEYIVSRIPLVRSIHNSVKQVMDTIFKNDGDSFRKVLLVEYPKKDMWSIAFQTSSGFDQAEKHTGKDLLTVFIPTTPNPTSGFLLFVPRENAIELDISTEEALRLVISLGVVLPNEKELVKKSIEENN